MAKKIKTRTLFRVKSRISGENFLKRAILVKLYLEISQNNSIFGKKKKKKKALFCHILHGVASDYQKLISFGLFLVIYSNVAGLLFVTLLKKKNLLP